MAIGYSFVDTSVSVLILAEHIMVALAYCTENHLVHVSLIKTYDCRIRALTVQAKCGPILFMCVYMPTDYGDSESYENYIETCAKITSLYTRSEAVHLVIAGDFNYHTGSRFTMF